MNLLELIHYFWSEWQRTNREAAVQALRDAGVSQSLIEEIGKCFVHGHPVDYEGKVTSFVIGIPKIVLVFNLKDEAVTEVRLCPESVAACQLSEILDSLDSDVDEGVVMSEGSAVGDDDRWYGVFSPDIIV